MLLYPTHACIFLSPFTRGACQGSSEHPMWNWGSSWSIKLNTKPFSPLTLHGFAGGQNLSLEADECALQYVFINSSFSILVISSCTNVGENIDHRWYSGWWNWIGRAFKNPTEMLVILAPDTTLWELLSISGSVWPVITIPRQCGQS